MIPSTVVDGARANNVADMKELVFQLTHSGALTTFPMVVWHIHKPPRTSTAVAALAPSLPDGQVLYRLSLACQLVKVVMARLGSPWPIGLLSSRQLVCTRLDV